MANFYITRKSFPDRLLTFDELDTFIDMIRRWYLLAVGKRGNTAHIHCETIIYAFPRQNAQTIRDTLAPLIPDALWDSPDPDELRATGIATNAVDTISSTVWQNILSQPIIQDTCIRLRITIRGQMPQQKIGTKTFVFCGAPSPFGLLLKAIWDLGEDERWEKVARSAAWTAEPQLLKAFDLYMQYQTTQQSEAAHKLSYAFFRKKDRHLFQSRKIERQVLWLTSLLVELPHDRRRIAFSDDFSSRLSSQHTH